MKKKKKITILTICLLILSLVMMINLSYADSGWDSSYGGDSSSSGNYGGYSDYNDGSDYSYDSGDSGLGSSMVQMIIFFAFAISFVISQIALAIHKREINKIKQSYYALEDLKEEEVNKYIPELSNKELKETLLIILKKYINNDKKVCTDKMLENKIELNIKNIVEYVDINIIKVNEKKEIVLYLVYKYNPIGKNDIELYDNIKIYYIYDKYWKIDKIEKV